MSTRTSAPTAAAGHRAGDEHFDVLIVGAGLSGIGAGYHLQKHCPGKSYAILEGRERSGGTWDLFRYPGIRSDSDMYTLGYSFRPWREAKAIADGPSILKYVRDTAHDYGIDKRIRFNHRVTRASWSSAEARWTVEAEQATGDDCTDAGDRATQGAVADDCMDAGGRATHGAVADDCMDAGGRATQGAVAEVARFTCNFLFMCSGYYNYEAGYMPQFAGAERFKGRIVHPQKWTDDIDYAGKRVVVIGSGATAVTLVPEMARTAAHVTMLQRSPTYIVARPQEDAIANWLRRHLSAKLAYGLTRWKNVLLGMLFYNLCRRAPERMKQRIIELIKNEVGGSCDVDQHFTPRYNPWDQRLCLVPNGDLFQVLKAGQASVVTDHIETFTEHGLKLRSGAELAADLIVTATGLNLQVLGALQLSVDGQPVELSKTLTYKGMMYSDVPNLASAFGYTNASWTLKCDLTCEYVCRLLNHMDRQGYRQCTPRNTDPAVTESPWIDFTSGYVQRSIGSFPKQGSKAPWRLYQNYALDLMNFRFAAVEDGIMDFDR